MPDGETFSISLASLRTSQCIQFDCGLVSVYCYGNMTFCALLDKPYSAKDLSQLNNLPFSILTHKFSFYPDNSTSDCNQPHKEWLDAYFVP
ncbi:unnamed protein product [Caenorhabditis auriculariae]|uniref:Uncharacterized protein n=1 Tax=Caenorhabditis auriculariae TaxID=2777116 RepID=A0A8S1HH60_9PELO|nr:unnamed protein product [Caenorhabditis auriculariae]